jgi:hypothetical protein
VFASARPESYSGEVPETFDSRGAVTVSENISSERTKVGRWLWPLGLMATGLAGAAVTVLRGCWHQNMSWPVRTENHSYQVCLGCGIRRLFDEQNFRSYGPYSYDLTRLVAWEEAKRLKAIQESSGTLHRPAS